MVNMRDGILKTRIVIVGGLGFWKIMKIKKKKKKAE